MVTNSVLWSGQHHGQRDESAYCRRPVDVVAVGTLGPVDGHACHVACRSDEPRYPRGVAAVTADREPVLLVVESIAEAEGVEAHQLDYALHEHVHTDSIGRLTDGE